MGTIVWEEPGESFAAPPQLLLVAVAVLLGDAIAVFRRRKAGLFSSFEGLLRPVRGRGGGTGPRSR